MRGTLCMFTRGIIIDAFYVMYVVFDLRGSRFMRTDYVFIEIVCCVASGGKLEPLRRGLRARRGLQGHPTHKTERTSLTSHACLPFVLVLNSVRKHCSVTTPPIDVCRGEIKTRAMFRFTVHYGVMVEIRRLQRIKKNKKPMSTAID